MTDEATPPVYRKQEQEPAQTEVTELAPGVYRFMLPIELPGLGHVNCYALEDERGLALVDPGLPSDTCWDALLDRLAQIGAELRHVHTVVVTHSHFDHFGSATRIGKETGADLLTHEAFRTMWEDREIAESPDLEDNLDEGAAIAQLRKQFGRKNAWGSSGKIPSDAELRRILENRGNLRIAAPRPTIRVHDSQVVRFAGREWVSIHTPGHTQDHLCLLDPAEGLLLSGDHVLPTITPHIGGGSDADPLARFFESLERMEAIPGVRLALPAHGHPFTDLAGRAAEIREHHLERLDILRHAAADTGRAPVEIFMRLLFRERSWGDMAASETYAHLEHLRLLGQAEMVEEAGVKTYLVQ